MHNYTIGDNLPIDIASKAPHMQALTQKATPLDQINFLFLSDCPATVNIESNNCGSCSTATDNTTVTCTDVPTNSSVCKFAVQTIIRGSIAGNASIYVTTRNTKEGNICILMVKNMIQHPFPSCTIVIIQSIEQF